MIITSKVSQKINIDANNSDKVSFEIITKENGVIIKKTKRTY